MKHLLIAIALAAGCSASFSAPGDADAADSLDFNAFHEHKEGAITLWDSDKGELGLGEKKTTVTYDAKDKDKATATMAPDKAPAAAVPTEDMTPNEARAHALQQQQAQEKLSHGEGFDGQRFMIRTRYTPTNVAKALGDLHTQMAQHCPQGWLVLREWSLPVDREYYLHTLFQCAGKPDNE